MRGLDAFNSNVLCLIARLMIAHEGGAENAKSKAESLISQIQGDGVRSIANAIVRNDTSNPAAVRYLSWARGMRRAATNSYRSIRKERLRARRNTLQLQ